MTRLAVGVALLILAAIAGAIGLVLVRLRVAWKAGPNDAFLARAVWHELERDPDFSPSLRRGEADLTAGKGVPWEPTPEQARAGWARLAEIGRAARIEPCRCCSAIGHTTAWHVTHRSWTRPSTNSPSWTRDSSAGFGESGW